MDMSLLESKLAFYNLRFNRKQSFMAISEIENTWRTERARHCPQFRGKRHIYASAGHMNKNSQENIKG